MKKTIFVLLLTIYSIIVIFQALNDPNKSYNEKIEFGKVQYKIDFNKLNNKELELEENSLKRNKKKIEKIADSLKVRHADDIKKYYDNLKFSNNRSRIVWGNLNDKKTEISLPCRCIIQNDTVFINSGFGFFGGGGVDIKINNDKFISYFYEYTDVPTYKKTKNDDRFVKSIKVGAKYQNLLIEDKPKYNELLTGHLTFLTNPYYTGSTKEEALYENFMDIEMYFQCIVIKYLE